MANKLEELKKQLDIEYVNEKYNELMEVVKGCLSNGNTNISIELNNDEMKVYNGVLISLFGGGFMKNYWPIRCNKSLKTEIKDKLVADGFTVIENYDVLHLSEEAKVAYERMENHIATVEKNKTDKKKWYQFWK